MLNGIAAAPGITIGPAYLYSKEKIEINAGNISDVDEAIQNFREAITRSKYELNKILNIALEKMGEKRAAIFEAQIMILDDPILLEEVERRIRTEKKSPEFIVHTEISKYQAIMDASDESYMKERSHDIDDIKNRIIRNLQKKRLQSKLRSDVIVIANTLSPADTILLSKNNVRGFITNFGGLTSHAAIVARSLSIPAVVGTHEATERIKNDDIIIMDGFHGVVILDPTEDELNFYHSKIIKLSKVGEELSKLRDVPAVTTDGREIILRGNIDLPEEIETLITNGAKGIGLLRTEQVFGELETFPDEEEQFEMYSKFAEKIYPEFIVIRVFDVGGDKFLPHDIKEPNPFLGWRGIRFLLDNTEIFKTQIRAILRASVHKNIKIMLPMIASLQEIQASKSLINQCKEELKKKKIKFDSHIPVGIMVEIPSAAILASDFAKVVDFLSIGTNDLIQFILAVDRGNDIVSEEYDEFHPGVIRTINHIIKHGKESNAFVSICGEMAADSMAVPLLVGMGLDSISASPAAIPNIKNIIRNISYDKAQALTNECLKYDSTKEVTELINKFFKDNLIKHTKNIF